MMLKLFDRVCRLFDRAVTVTVTVTVFCWRARGTQQWDLALAV
jgi:hypothetical protein